MPERRSYLDQEIYWDGHSFRDNCPPLVKTNEARKSCAIGCVALPYIITASIVEMMRESRVDKNAYKQLKEFLRLMPEAPIQNLPRGKVFEPKDYPIGTVLKIAKASEWYRNLYEGELWGLIVQDHDKRDIVLAYNQEQFNNTDLPLLPDRFGGPIEIGAVTHTVIGGLQVLSRYDKMEIWQYGHGIRERVKEKSTVPKSFLKHA